MVNLQKREKILLVLALVALGFFVVNKFLLSSKPRKGSLTKSTVAQNLGVQSPARSPKPKPTTTVKASEPKSIPVSWGRDPFTGAIRTAHLDSTKQDSTAFRLKAISWKQGEAYALIGDYILREGERAENLEILEIQRKQVICRLNGKIITFAWDNDEKHHP